MPCSAACRVSRHCAAASFPSGRVAPILQDDARLRRPKARELGPDRRGRAVGAVERSGAAGRWSRRCRRFSGPKLLNTSGAGAAGSRGAGDEVPLHFARLYDDDDSCLPPRRPRGHRLGRPLPSSRCPNGAVMMAAAMRGQGDLDTGDVAHQCRAPLPTMCAQGGPVPSSRSFHCPELVRWSSCRTTSVIGQSAHAPDAFHAFGFCGTGFQLAPGSAR